MVLIESDREVLERPKIEFERHTGPIDPELIAVKKSRENNYVSVNITIAATGKKQLGKIFEDLKRIKSVKMVL